MYEEVNPNESLFLTQESDVNVNKVCEASPFSNQSTTDTVNVIDEKITVPMELHHEDEAPASSNNTVYEEVTPQETLNSGMDDQKMESKTTSTIEQALECNGMCMLFIFAMYITRRN